MAKDNSFTQLTRPELIRLAPLELANYREDRFRGDSNRSHLSEYKEEDRKLLLRIYNILQGLFEEMLRGHHDPAHTCRVLNENADKREQIVADVGRLGVATLEMNQGRHLAQVVHDIRGGALQSLLIRWEMFSVLPDTTPGLSAIFFLLRDHLKIMRNCVSDLDLGRFADDSARKDHGTDLLLEKWTSADFYGGSIPAQIEFDCSYNGTLCESCLEFSTLDRIIYNLLNNAARNADDHVVQFHILPTPEQEKAENLRFVIANHVSGEQETRLNAVVPDLGQLFHSGFTTDGHGVGMSIVADFCTQAFGIYDDEKARKDRYYGAQWIDGNFVAWFHWPVAGA
jgi:signal transduction histidine kinase